jgi:hypothetical protein
MAIESLKKRRRNDRTLAQVLVGVTMALCGAVSAQDTIHLEEIEVVDRISDTTPKDVDEESGFKTSDQVARQYVAIVVEVTKTDTIPIDASLVRGPAEISNAALKDLKVSALQSTRAVSTYSMADPRFAKRERSVTGHMSAWIELDSATAVIYVPLSALIDKVEIAPEPSRSDTVSSGGEFDPRPWATGACDGHDPDLYPDCSSVIALGISPLP